jgi:hypothetical protein
LSSASKAEALRLVGEERVDNAREDVRFIATRQHLYDGGGSGG